MSGAHYQAYMVAWDWLLYALWAFVWLAAVVGIVAVICVEYDNRRRPK